MKFDFLTRDNIAYEVNGHKLDQIVNYNEIMVLEVMKGLYKADSTVCKCSLCVEDIYALSLNKLPPRYIQSTNADIYINSRGFVGLDEVKKEVMEAAKKIKEKPAH